MNTYVKFKIVPVRWWVNPEFEMDTEFCPCSRDEADLFEVQGQHLMDGEWSCIGMCCEWEDAKSIMALLNDYAGRVHNAHLALINIGGKP